MIALDFNKGEEWYTELHFKEIEGFRDTGSYTALKSGKSNGIIGISVQSSDFESPQEFQNNAINYFNENQKIVLNALCQGLLDFYPSIMEMYNIEEYDEEYGFPKLTAINDVKEIIGIGIIHVRDDQKAGFAYLGFECGCPWDEEHGLGIIMYKDKVIEIETADISFCGSKAVRKDNGTYTEAERFADEQMEKKIADNIAKYNNEEEEAKLKSNKRWWEFWKK